MESKGKGLLILNVIQLIIIGVLAFLLFNNNKEIEGLNETVSTQSKEMIGKKAELLDIKENLVRIRDEREALGLANDSLDAQIAELDGVVAQLEKKNSISRAQIRKLTANIKTMQADIDLKDNEISKLKEDNALLSENVDSLSKTTTKLSLNLDSISIENEHMTKDLKWASVLNAESIKVQGYKESGKEYGKQPFPSKKLSQVKVTFDLADNKAAEHNKKTFYLRMITPSGECFSDKRNGGGTLTDHEGNEIKYTLNKKLAFENTNQFVSMVMLKGYNYSPGNYIIQIYCEGYDIGPSSFIVK